MRTTRRAAVWDLQNDLRNAHTNISKENVVSSSQSV